MTKRQICALSLLVVFTLTGCASKPKIDQGELLRRTQEMFDGVAKGDQTSWKKYYADDAMYFDEKGRNMNKAALVADITPLPTGYSGSIKVGAAQSHIEGTVAILSYDLNETETVFGQNMTARYHGTDTWMLRNGEWKIVAGQMLRYYEDPAPGVADARRYGEYVGKYELAPGVIATVSTDGGQLYREREHRAKDLLVPEAWDVFFRKGVEGRILFRRNAAGTVDALIDRRNNEDIVWTRIKVK